MTRCDHLEMVCMGTASHVVDYFRLRAPGFVLRLGLAPDLVLVLGLVPFRPVTLVLAAPLCLPVVFAAAAFCLTRG